MKQVRKKHRSSLPITIIVCIALVIASYLSLPYFLEGYRGDIYDRIINSSISALKETTSTLISKTTEGFDHCRYEICVLGIGMSRKLKGSGSDSIDGLSNGDRSYFRDFNKVSVFDHYVLLSEPGRGVYSQGDSVKPVNLYSSQAYVDCLNSPDGEAISFTSDPFSAPGQDVVVPSCRAGFIIPIGIYSQKSFRALHDSIASGDNASYMITIDSGLVLSRTHVNRELGETLNLFTYFEENPLNAEFFRPDAQGGTEYERILPDFRDDKGGSAEIYSGDSRHELVYAPILRIGWGFISYVSYNHITADVAQTNQETIQLTMLITVLTLGMFLVIVITLVSVVRANVSGEAARRDRIFTLMTHYMPDVIAITDSESGTIEYVSRNMEQALEIEDAFGNAIEDRFLDCISGSDHQAVLDLISRVRRGDCASGNLELYFTRPDIQKDIVLSLNAYPVSEQDSSQHFITVTLEDITEREQSRRRLEETLESETQANVAKGTFLVSMSHDIRTPLSAIIGLTSLALHLSEDSRKVTECLQKIANSSQLLLGLVNNVLDMSKIESGKMQLVETGFELNEWLSGVVTVTQSQTGVCSRHSDVNVWNIIHELLYGDTVRLGQVLTNVLGSAVKFTPKDGEIYLDITEALSQDPSFASLVFRISDTGVDMSREYMGRIFEMFSQDQNFYKQGIRGTDLGMAITKRIVDLMGGTIRVESEPEGDTTFTIGLSIRLSSRHVSLVVGCTMLVIGKSRSEERCRDTVERLEEIGVNAAWETDYQAAVSLATQKRAVGRPFSMVFFPYKMFRFDRTLTGEQLKRDLGRGMLWPLGLEPDEQGLFEEIKQKGSKYIISLPLFRMSLYRKITGMLRQGESISGGPVGELKGVRLLMVENNAVNPGVTVEMFSGFMGAAVGTTRNGEKGCIRLLDAPEDTYDVILMNLQVPVLEGLDAARRIWESIYPRVAPTPIITLTANAPEEDRGEAPETGMNGLVLKPIDFAVLAKETGRAWREGRCLRLLSAEGNELSREIVAELIRADGQQAGTVGNGHQVLGAYLNAPDGTYNAILLDLRMPVMDGFEAVAAIHSSQRKSVGSIPISAFTPGSKDEVRPEVARVGFGAVLTKPVNMEQLRGLLG